MRKLWPDLVLRAKNAKRREEARQDWPGKQQGWSRPKEVKLGDALAALLNKVVEESLGAGRDSSEMTEDQYVAHLKDCMSCRKNVATFARMGVDIPSKILIAAGVEVLN